MTISSMQSGWRSLSAESSREGFDEQNHSFEEPITKVTRQEVNRDSGGCAFPAFPADAPAMRRLTHRGKAASRECFWATPSGTTECIHSQIGLAADVGNSRSLVQRGF